MWERSLNEPLTYLYATELHLQEYHQRVLAYLKHFDSAPPPPPFTIAVEPKPKPNLLEAVSPPSDPHGYADTCISGDMITDVYLEWVHRTRQPESEQHLRTLTGK